MKQSRAAIRYAKALLTLTQEHGVLEKAYKDMCFVDKVYSQNKDFVLLLKSPIIKTDLKLKILEQLFKNKLTKVTMDFISIIASKRREKLLGLITSAFIFLYKENKNIATATVTTAIPIDEGLKKEVIRFVQKGGNQEVELKEIVDESILGGVVIRSGGKQLDASIFSAIYELKQKFNKNLYLQDY